MNPEFYKINSNRIYALDIARAVAILLVWMIHILMNILQLDISSMWYLAYLGVDIFFALSGFLIGRILISLCKDDMLSPSAMFKFLLKRWFRTAPLYFVFLLLNYFVYRYILHSADHFDFRYLYWGQSLYSYPPDFFGESWSLCVEEWFYFSFSAGLCIFTHVAKKWSINFHYKLLLFAVLYILLFTALRLWYAPNDYTEFNIVLYRLDAIAYGVLAAVADVYYQKNIRSSMAFITGIICSISGILLFLSGSYIGTWYQLYYLLTGAGIAMIIFSMNTQNNWYKKHLFTQVISFISRISYSVYLVNLTTIYLLLHYFPAGSIFLRIILSITAIVLITFISSLTYKYIELPFLKLRNNLHGMKIKHPN